MASIIGQKHTDTQGEGKRKRILWSEPAVKCVQNKKCQTGQNRKKIAEKIFLRGRVLLEIFIKFEKT